jgi:hypothetical protein
MALAKKELAAQVQVVIGDALERVRRLVKDSVSKELRGLIAGAEIGGRGLVPRKGKKVAKKAAKKVAKKVTGKAAKKTKPVKKTAGPKLSSEGRVKALVDLVNKAGVIAPKDARKVLKLTATQMQTLARNTSKEGLIKVEGQGRGTKYRKA